MWIVVILTGYSYKRCHVMSTVRAWPRKRQPQALAVHWHGRCSSVGFGHFLTAPSRTSTFQLAENKSTGPGCSVNQCSFLRRDQIRKAIRPQGTIDIT